MEKQKIGGIIKVLGTNLFHSDHGKNIRARILVKSPWRKRIREPRTRASCEGDTCLYSGQKADEGGGEKRKANTKAWKEEKVIPFSVVVFALNWRKCRILKWKILKNLVPRQRKLLLVDMLR